MDRHGRRVRALITPPLPTYRRGARLAHLRQHQREASAWHEPLTRVPGRSFAPSSRRAAGALPPTVVHAAPPRHSTIRLLQHVPPYGRNSAALRADRTRHQYPSCCYGTGRFAVALSQRITLALRASTRGIDLKTCVGRGGRRLPNAWQNGASTARARAIHALSPAALRFL